MKAHAVFHQRSLEDRDAFWLEQARLIARALAGENIHRFLARRFSLTDH